MKFANETEKLKDILTNFKAPKSKRTVWGNYRIEGNSLVFCTSDTMTYRRCHTIKEMDEWAKENEIERFSYHGSPVDREYLKNRIKESSWGIEITGHFEVREEIARKVDDNGETRLIGNSSILKYIGRTVAYGNVNYNRSVTKIQEIMSTDKDFAMIPFSVFKTAALDLNKFHQIEKLKEETIKEKHEDEIYNKKEDKYEKVERFEDRHFTGASLFSVDGKIYLFDIDRGEIKHGIFNPFLATIPKKVKTVAEAYEALKPKEVIAAEKKGLKILRQGEWFFIPCKAPKKKKLTPEQKMIVLASMADSWESDRVAKAMGISKDALRKKAETLTSGIPREMNLQAGNSRPNTVDSCVIEPGKTYCTGKVRHTGREHKDLILKGWYLAVPNTSIENFTVTGDVD